MNIDSLKSVAIEVPVSLTKENDYVSKKEGSEPITKEKNISKDNGKATKDEEPSEIQKEVDKLNVIMEAMNRKLEFVVDDRLKNQMVVKVVDKDSGKVIRQYPAEEMIKVMARIEESILGALVDDKA
ncbi:MAG: hypothetical protein DKM50_03900 [Candidatus Margulisiibacteriota bacterium]|nr:MAG: hypothetical protein A2X43_01615 [Candidatus Margulisbacteria bacterium GWD2_39_127]PZM82279.1 MAG: hypothetical protein DKM50_03900 [Candidatus Margulisiibacteriota bacterium]HAR62975.1 hypothetical protein [Candidatus Margulisiibacteriota bacterium]HCY36988.1 hypothetical protein [Candidatus Margulisiibacteriota bacterium]